MTNETQRANEGCYMGAADYDRKYAELQADCDAIIARRRKRFTPRPRLIRSHWQFAALVFVAAFIVFLFGGTAL